MNGQNTQTKMGNRVSTVSDLLTIKIGGDPNDKKVKKENNRIKSTKYTLITFLPQNLLEQFRRIANFYFLIMTVISLVIDSPVSPLTSLMPLVFVISVTAAKQGYEDFLRHRADNMVNYSYVTVVRNGVEVDIKCQEILQGDIVMAVKDCDVPCDLVLIKSSDPNLKCHITTANLDGETNLKTLMVPKGLPNVALDKLHTLGTIECEQPRTDLYTFTGRIELGPIHRKERDSILTEFQEGRHTLPLMAENLLLRGSRIKNTEWAIGCAVYTGQNTKLSLNSRLTRKKICSSEKYVNKFLVFFLLILIAIVTTSYFLKRYFDNYHSVHNLYLGDINPDANPVTQILQDYFSFLILFNYLIPISLYVTIELHKFIGSLFMEWDVDLYDSDTNQPCIVNTSDLNEELGQINILFSDKTGTLTKNEMIFQECSINGKKYNFLGSGIRQEGRPNIVKIHEFKDDVFDFFQTLSACHTVQVATTAEPEGETTVTLNGNTNGVVNGSVSGNINGNAVELRSVNSFTNITEESEVNNTQESDFDETDFVKQQSHETVQNVPYAGPVGDISPLLNERKVNILDANDNNNIKPPSDNIVVKRLDNRIHPRRPVSLFETETQSPPPVVKLARPLSIEFTRTISHIEMEPRGAHMTHRRTQSYGASTNHNRQQSMTIASNLRPQSRTAALLRHSGTITSMREYYAAPSFIEASLIERKESVRRRQEINNAIQELDYQASSPDEKALVEACAKIGFLYTGEVNDILTVKIKPYQSAYIKKPVVDNDLHFERLHTLEFTSDRKRMSTLVKDRKGQIWLLTKGAESHVLPLCQKSSPTLIAETQQHINDFAKVGLRTLAVARKKMTLEEYAIFDNEITAAGNSLTDRNTRIAEVQAKLENNLELLGATAVEDALQDNVKDTLESLRHAGIKVWVLTGDKVETALNIALSCGHIPENANKYFITECTADNQLLEHFDVLENEMQQDPQALFSLLIDGSSLSIALTSYPKRFRDLAIKCRAVLCCRLSPLQKCEVVRLMKTVKEKPITAAIGDGANDVSMIQEAHVGLGIVGREGRQAARCADYAFANFCMLKKVLLVHGYYYSQRLALLVLYFFYKNLVFMLNQLYFQTNSMFSSETIYDSVFLTLYNVAYTSLPVLVISLSEKIYPEERLMNNPPLYKENTGNKRLTWKYFVGWMLLGCYHSVVIYMSGYAMWINNCAILSTERTADFQMFGTFMIHNVVVLVNLKLWMEAKYQTIWFVLSCLGSIVFFVVSTVIYNLFILNFDGDLLWVYNNLLSSLTFWLLFVMIQVACLLPDFSIMAFKAFNIKIGPIFPGEDFRIRTLYKKRKIESTYL